jgi:FemAB-related protein (PEP-CTERM system-associated)
MRTPSLTALVPAPPPMATVQPSVSVRSLEAEKMSAWDDFVWRHPQATFFHLTGWMRVIVKTFQYTPRYFLAERGERITGILPLFETRNWLQGKCLISTPMAVYGGICAEDEESRLALLDMATQIARRENVQHLELRQRDGEVFPDFHPNTLYATFYGELAEDPEVLLRRLPRDTRYMIRKAQKKSLRVVRGSEQTPTLYNLFAQSMRRLGTPVFPPRLFENLVEEFKTRVDITVLFSQSTPVAGVLSFLFRDMILPYYAGASPEAFELAANNLLYWELMKRSAAQGIRWFDFGRSKRGTGAYAFKTQWSMTLQPLSYQLYLVKSKNVPNFTPLNPRFERAARIWSKLPLGLTKRIGPHVVRWFP